MTEKQASSEIALSDEDRKRLLLLLGSEMDKAEMTWYPGKVIDPVLRAMLVAERDTRERLDLAEKKLAEQSIEWDGKQYSFTGKG